MPTHVRHQGLMAGSALRRRLHAAPGAVEPVTGPPTASELLAAVPGAIGLVAVAYAALVILSLSWPA
jgi:hypothetical protein